MDACPGDAVKVKAEPGKCTYTGVDVLGPDGITRIQEYAAGWVGVNSLTKHGRSCFSRLLRLLERWSGALSVSGARHASASCFGYVEKRVCGTRFCVTERAFWGDPVEMTLAGSSGITWTCARSGTTCARTRTTWW